MDYDYVIVGAGSAGAALAARLSERPGVQVALIEAGPDYTSAEAPAAMRSPNPNDIVFGEDYGAYRWDGLLARRTGLQSPRRYWRGRGLGGTSAINGQIAIRGVQEDFDEWEQDGCAGWSFAEVLPAFRRLETDERFGSCDYHGDRGPIPIYRAPLTKWGPVDHALAEAALDAGHPWEPDHNAPGTTGVSPYAINSRDGVRVSTNDAYIEAARGRNNLAIFCDAHVDQILFDGHLRAIGVRVLNGDARRDIYGNAVVLSAGAIHSPAILMRSGIGPADHLKSLGIAVRADLPVGLSFQDHPCVFLQVQLNDQGMVPRDFRHTNVCVRYSSGLAGAGSNDMMMLAMNRFGDSLGHHVEKKASSVGLVGVWVNRCFSRGSVRLPSKDPFDHPNIEQSMLSDQSDLIRMRDGVRRLALMAKHNSFEFIGGVRPPIDANASDAEVDAFVLNSAGDTQHSTSTCRMGDPTQSTTVVDPACRVLGVEALRVVDASIMPQVVRANTHLTTVMIAEVMADRLQGEHQ